MGMTAGATSEPTSVRPSADQPRARPERGDTERFRESLERHAQPRQMPGKRGRGDDKTGGEAGMAMPHPQPEGLGHQAKKGERDVGDTATAPVGEQPRGAAQATAAPAPSANANSADATLHAAFADRLALGNERSSSETSVSFGDARWLAREALVVGGASGEISLSLQLREDGGDNPNEAADELRRRLEARGLTVDRVELG
ncbi:hypothetical protein AB2M62_14825 [Sphingomonas sp. MMS12-HWE2-04]|uniref:hypothetical protein n=1 Tax=Sphingomonas sp. MMS12-HWE2-04 TaxID=3234199 RepID=UPI00384E52BD